MAVTIRSTFSGADRARQLVENAETALNRQLQIEATQIITRTQSGRAVNGSGFDDYSDGYAEFRRKAGRRTSPVDLTFTGQMLQAITTTVRKVGDTIEGRIFFADAESAAKARFNSERRSFFGLSDEQRERLRAAVYEAIGRK